MRISIIGAGAAGLCAAAEAVARGHDVVVHEASDALLAASEARWAGGMLAPGCEGETAEEPVLRLGRGAVDWWEARGAQVHRRGALVLAPPRDRAELDRFARRTTGWTRIDAARIAALEPELAGRFSEALFFEQEAHLDPRRALAGLAEGLDIRLGRAIAPRELDGAVIDARGLAAPAPGLRAVRGEMAILRADLAVSRTIRLLHPRFPCYLVPRGDGLFMLGATQIESADRRGVTARGAMELLGALYALHPGFAEAEISELGAGLRPAFADNMPRVWREGMVVSINGLYRHGFLLGPACARAAVDLLEGDASQKEFAA